MDTPRIRKPAATPRPRTPRDDPDHGPFPPGRTGPLPVFAAHPPARRRGHGRHRRRNHGQRPIEGQPDPGSAFARAGIVQQGRHPHLAGGRPVLHPGPLPPQRLLRRQGGRGRARAGGRRQGRLGRGPDDHRGRTLPVRYGARGGGSGYLGRGGKGQGRTGTGFHSHHDGGHRGGGYGETGPAATGAAAGPGGGPGRPQGPGRASPTRRKRYSRIAASCSSATAIPATYAPRWTTR